MQTGHAARHTTGEVGDSRAMIHHGPGETGQFRGTHGAHPWVNLDGVAWLLNVMPICLTEIILAGAAGSRPVACLHASG